MHTVGANEQGAWFQYLVIPRFFVWVYFCHLWTISTPCVIYMLINIWVPVEPGPEVIKLFSCSTQLSTKFQLLIITKIPNNEEVSSFKSIRC